MFKECERYLTTVDEHCFLYADRFEPRSIYWWNGDQDPWGKHVDGLGDTLALISRYTMLLNPDKFSFGVQARRFLGFMLTNRGIEANPDKCPMIIIMRILTSIKEVQQLIGRIVALSRFPSWSGDKFIHFCTTLRKEEKILVDGRVKKGVSRIKELFWRPFWGWPAQTKELPYICICHPLIP